MTCHGKFMSGDLHTLNKTIMKQTEYTATDYMMIMIVILYMLIFFLQLWL